VYHRTSAFNQIETQICVQIQETLDEAKKKKNKKQKQKCISVHTFVAQKTQLRVFFLTFLDFTKIYSNIFKLSFTDLLPQQVRNNALCTT